MKFKKKGVDLTSDDLVPNKICAFYYSRLLPSIVIINVKKKFCINYTSHLESFLSTDGEKEV